MSRKNVIFRIFGMATCFLFIIGLMFEPSADWNFKRQEVGSSYFQQDSANASWSPANVTEYHSELHYCTRTTKYKLTESELKTRRKEVTEAVTFPEVGSKKQSENSNRPTFWFIGLYSYERRCLFREIPSHTILVTVHFKDC